MAFSLQLLLAFILATDEPLTADELQVAVSAVEEFHSRVQSLRVRYRLKQQSQPGARGIEVSSEEFTVDWTLQKSKEHFLVTTPTTRFEWWYDGKTTAEWDSKRGEPDKVERVSIDHSPPRPSLRCNDLAGNLGLRRRGIEQGLASLASHAMRHQSLTGARRNELWTVSLGKHEVNSGTCEIIFDLDPNHDLRLSSWTLLEFLPAKDQGKEPTTERHSYVIDEFQQVSDQAAGASIWFPLRAHYDQPLVLTSLEIDSVQLNRPIDESEFVPPPIPFGVIVTEQTAPGKMPISYLMGGKPAEEFRLKDLSDLADRERVRLDKGGVRFDATPGNSSSGPYWFVVGACCFLFALLIKILPIRRKSA